MSTRRADFRAALLAILDDFRLAHPTWIRQTYNARPASFAPPMAYVGIMGGGEVVLEFGSRMSRPNITGQLLIVEGTYENAGTAMRLDEKADALMTYLVDQHSRVSGATLLEAVSEPEDVELPIGDAVYMAALISVRLNAVD